MSRNRKSKKGSSGRHGAQQKERLQNKRKPRRGERGTTTLSMPASGTCADEARGKQARPHGEHDAADGKSQTAGAGRHDGESKSGLKESARTAWRGAQERAGAEAGVPVRGTVPERGRRTGLVYGTGMGRAAFWGSLAPAHHAPFKTAASHLLPPSVCLPYKLSLQPNSHTAILPTPILSPNVSSLPRLQFSLAMLSPLPTQPSARSRAPPLLPLFFPRLSSVLPIIITTLRLDLAVARVAAPDALPSAMIPNRRVFSVSTRLLFPLISVRSAPCFGLRCARSDDCLLACSSRQHYITTRCNRLLALPISTLSTLPPPK
jgi:hypothetical protein